MTWLPALITSSLALIGVVFVAIYNYYHNRALAKERQDFDEKLANLKAAQDKELEDFRSKSATALEETKARLTQAREEAEKAEEAAHVIAKYRDPLLQSAYDLQSRIWNIYSGGFMGYRDPEYFQLNTMFLFGQFLAWLEIIRREIQFLDLGAVQATKDLSRKLEKVQGQIATTNSKLPDDFYIYRGYQRALGELMMVRTDGPTATGPRYECMGYAAFVAAHKDPVFAKWFTRLGDAISQLAKDKPERLVWVQRALIDLIDLLDPGHDRFEQSRNRLPEPESPKRRSSRLPLRQDHMFTMRQETQIKGERGGGAEGSPGPGQ